MEILFVVLLLGLVASAVGWTTRRTFAGTAAADAWSAVAWMDGAARRAGQAGGRAVLRFGLSDQEVTLSVDGAEPAGPYRRALPRGLRIQELWVAGREAFSGEVTLAASGRGHLPTYAMLVSRPGARPARRPQWWVRAGATGQLTRFDDRFAVREVFDALR